ncbi:serine hydrolase domain-containing protein [Actinoplanes sp. NPDC024001]|uniref:serine hydrolase domain-containing protein n=1 Tax=Actinoplanes sp. NPDC024001 TaxID=3154598 RepID=UPI0033F872D8
MLAAALVTAIVALTAPAADPIEAHLQQHRADQRIPGLAYAVVSGDRVVRQGAWGVDGDGHAVTAQTPFLIGSVSKPVTATAVMRLVEARRLALDDPVRRHLPWFRLADGQAAQHISVRHLLTHTSGLPRWASRTDRFDNSAGGLARSVRDLAGVRLQSAPGTHHHYSDANYMVLGAVVEAVTGQPFGAALRREVLDPLGMRHSAATQAEADSVGLPAGHRYWFGQPRRFDAPYDTSGVPYGYVAASADDLARFAMAHLKGGRLLSEETLKLMHTGEYGLGWRTSTLDGIGTRLVWHAGATPGYFANVVLAPESGSAVVVLGNSYSPALDAPLAAAAFDVTRLLHGGTPTSSNDGDPLMRAMLPVLVAVAGLLTVTAIWSLTRAIRSSRPAEPRLRSTLAWLAACTAVAGVAALLPSMMGNDLGQALLWMPDVGWAIIAVITLAALLAAIRVGIAVARRRARPVGVEAAQRRPA